MGTAEHYSRVPRANQIEERKRLISKELRHQQAREARVSLPSGDWFPAVLSLQSTRERRQDKRNKGLSKWVTKDAMEHQGDHQTSGEGQQWPHSQRSKGQGQTVAQMSSHFTHSTSKVRELSDLLSPVQHIARLLRGEETGCNPTPHCTKQIKCMKRPPQHQQVPRPPIYPYVIA